MIHSISQSCLLTIADCMGQCDRTSMTLIWNSLLRCKHFYIWVLWQWVLTAGSFVLDADFLLQRTTHQSHLAGAAVGLAVGSAYGVGRLRAGFGTLAHRFVVLDHTLCPVTACYMQARARYVEIWRPTTQETEITVRGMVANSTALVVGENIKLRLERSLGLQKSTGDSEVS